jgi:hypothetical protein
MGQAVEHRMGEGAWPLKPCRRTYQKGESLGGGFFGGPGHDGGFPAAPDQGHPFVIAGKKKADEVHVL